MANWKITKDKLAAQVGGASSVGVASIGIENVDEATLTEKFKMYDDDNVLYFEGISDDANSQDAFAPLDDFGQPDSGCTRIDYLNKETGKYEVL